MEYSGLEFFFHYGNISWKHYVQKLIQVATDSEYWHVDVRYDDKLYVGASRRYDGLDIRPLTMLKPLDMGCHIRRARLLIPINKDKFFDRLLSQYGHKFSTAGLFYLGVLKATGNREAVNDWFAQNRVMCTPTLGELIYECCRKRDVKDLAKIAYGCISPADLARWDGIQMLEEWKWNG